MRMISTSVWMARMTNDFAPASGITVTIQALRAQNEGAEVAVQLLIENGEHRERKTVTLTMEQYCALRPQKGSITEEQYDALEAAGEYCRALRAGENLLSYGANSRQMLARKLTTRGYSREVSANVAAHLSDIGLINEENDMQREVEKCLRKLWGARRIRSHLWSRGFDSEAISNLPSLMEEIDFAENCATLIRKKYGTLPTDPDERRRMTASLSRYGYTLTEIREACRLIGTK